MWNLLLQTAEGSRTHDFCVGSTCQTSTRWQVEEMRRYIYCFIAKTLAAGCLHHTYLNVARTNERGSDSHAESPRSWWIEDYCGFHQFGNRCLLSAGCIRSDVHVKTCMLRLNRQIWRLLCALHYDFSDLTTYIQTLKSSMTWSEHNGINRLSQGRCTVLPFCIWTLQCCRWQILLLLWVCQCSERKCGPSDKKSAMSALCSDKAWLIWANKVFAENLRQLQRGQTTSTVPLVGFWLIYIERCILLSCLLPMMSLSQRWKKPFGAETVWWMD